MQNDEQTVIVRNLIACDAYMWGDVEYEMYDGLTLAETLIVDHAKRDYYLEAIKETGELVYAGDESANLRYWMASAVRYLEQLKRVELRAA